MYEKPIYSIVLVLILGSGACAATIHWTDAGGDKLWSNPNNWEGKQVPTIADEVYVDVPAAAAPNGPIIQDGIDAKILGLACEVAGEPTMTMTGGTLEIADWIWWGDGAGSHGTFTMSGGIVTVVNEHELGWGGGTGTWIMTGGSVSAGRLVIPTATGAAGQLYLHGGTYHVGTAGLSMTAVGLIDIMEGTLLLDGDRTTDIQGFINSGRITAYAGKGYFALDYDRRNPGVTTLTAAPLTGKAYKPDPPDGAKDVTVPLLTWGAGLKAVLHNVYLGTSPDSLQYMGRRSVTNYWHGAGLTPGTTYCWRIDEIEPGGAAIHTGDVWSFTAMPATAHDPRPWNEAKWVSLEVELTWAGGMDALSHDVYFGTDRAAVEAGDPGTFKRNQVTTEYDPGTLVQNTTYYWRVDEHTTDDTVHPGAVWSFTTIGPGGGVTAQYFANTAPTGSPVLTQVENAIDHNWGTGIVAGGLSDRVCARWTADLEAPLSESYTFITTSDDGVRLWIDDWLVIDNWTEHGATDNRVRMDLVAGQVYSIRMEWYDNTGSALAQLSWQSASIPRQIIPAGPLQLPGRATGPYPANTAVDTPQTPMLRWIPSASAAHHEVYFGEDAMAVAEGTTASAAIYRGRKARADFTYDPGTLEGRKTYYWRVDEVNDASPESPWKGTVWSFTTAGFFVVDDFESYADDSPYRIFQTWLDGFGYTEPEVVQGNGTGSTVGHVDAPFAERTIVYSGRQSLPMDYNNADAPYYSEAERTWATPQNWTANDSLALRLYVRGLPSNSPANLYVVVQDSANRSSVAPYPYPQAVRSAQWILWQVPISHFTAAGVDVTAVKKISLGVGDRDNPAPGGKGSLYIDDIHVAMPEFVGK
jgi:hypothetical protein